MIPNDTVHSGKQLASIASDLTDEEIKQTIRVVNDARIKFSGRPNTPKNLEIMRDEVLTKLAEISVLAEFDPSPCFYGEPPILEITGKIKGDPIYKEGFDHERKAYEVNKAHERGEYFYGEKETTNKKSRAAKKNAKIKEK